MSKSIEDKKWILIFAIILIIITSIPYAIGFLQEKNASWIFSGFVFGIEDGNSYIAKMLTGSYGDWLFRTPYTAYPQRGFFAFFPYLLIGKLASPPDVHLQLILLFQVFRWAGIYFLVAETYKFINIFIERKKTIQFAVVLSLLGGGLGWLIIFVAGSIWKNRLPLEFYSPESFGFLSIFGLPHLCFSRAFMLRSFRTLLNPNFELSPLKKHLNAGLYLLLSGIFQPLNIAIGWLVIASYKVLLFILSSDKQIFKEIKLFLSYISLSLPLLFYNLVMFRFDPYLKNWEQQNIIKSPPLIDYFWAYALGILCIIYVLFIEKKQFSNKKFLNVWLIIFPIMVYLPVNLQRRLSDGIWVCMSIFVALTVNSIRSNKLKYLFSVPFFLTTIIVYTGSLSTVFNYSYPVYQDVDLLTVFDTIEKSGEKGDVVVANYELSNILPAYIPMRVVIGHGPESKNLIEMEGVIDQIFTHQLSNEDYQNFINKFNIKFIVYLKNDRINNQEFEDLYPGSEVILRNDKFQVVEID